MLLMDAIMATADWVVASRSQSVPMLALYSDLGNDLSPRKGPRPARFVFDQKAILTATELTLSRPKPYREVMKHMQVPYPDLWIEWEENGREILREKMPDRTPEPLKALRPLPERLGFYVKADPAPYRRGVIRWAWKFKANHDEAGGETPNVSGIETHFDLDQEFPIEIIDKHPLDLAHLWEDNPVQNEAFHSIWKTARYIANEAAIAPIASNDTTRSILFADVVGEYIMVWACLMVLMESHRRNPNVVLRSVDMSKLNKARAKTGKRPLLDHRTVHIMPHRQTQPGSRTPLDYTRKSPHIHLVSSYLGWRGKIVFPYRRGIDPSVAGQQTLRRRA